MTTMEKSKAVIAEEGGIGVRTRSVLWYLTFFGFAISQFTRINVSIAIVDMVNVNHKKPTTINKTAVTSECFVAANFTPPSELNGSLNLLDESKFISLERRFLDFVGIEYERDGFKWNAKEQSLVLGSMFWLHWVTQLPGGILAAKYGTKKIFGTANFISSVMCFVMPIACYINYRWMIGLRVVQGFISGMMGPALNHLVGQWIPPNERSKFISAYLGSSFGVAIAYPMFGFIIKATSWEWAFHTCAICGGIWGALWLYYVYDSPELHPRIHPKEKEYIIQSLGSSVIRNFDKRHKQNIPWKAILTSRPVWINTLAQTGGIWGLLTVVTQAPTYFRFIHGRGIGMTGILSGFPHFLRVGFAIVFSNFGDYLLSNGKMSRNNVRRLATFVSLVLNGCAVIGLANSGCNLASAVFFLNLSLCLHGAVSTGTLASVVDIAPNYGGITLGIIRTITMIPSFISPIVVGFITFENQNSEAWRQIFMISSVMLIGSGVIYIIFNDTSIQDWNKIEEEERDEEESKPLNGNGVMEKRNDDIRK